MLEYFLNTQTVVVVLEGQGLIFAGHLLQLATNRPFVRPASIVQRIADCVVGNGSAVVRRQLILPVGIAIDIRNSLNRRTQRASGIRVLHLAGNVSAAIVIVNPRCILMRIIHANQLPKRIVRIGGGQITSLFGDDVAAGIVLVFEGNPVLGNLLHERSSAVRAVRAVDIGVGAGQSACRIAAFSGSSGDSAEIVVDVGHLLRTAIILNRRHEVIAVVGIVRGMRFAADLLRELFEIAEFVVLQQRAIQRFASFSFLQFRLTGTIREVIIRSRDSAEVIPLLGW